MITVNLSFGFISDIDPVKGLVKVEFQDETDEGSIDDGEDKTLVSDWIPISVRKSFKDKETFPYDINEHVWCMMDEYLEYGICCGSLYSDRDAPDGGGADIYRLLYKDGSYEMFDRSSGDRTEFYKGTYKLSTDEGGVYEVTDKHKIANNTYSLKDLIDELFDKILAMSFTNGGGLAPVTNNAADFTTLKAKFDALLT